MAWGPKVFDSLFVSRIDGRFGWYSAWDWSLFLLVSLFLGSPSLFLFSCINLIHMKVIFPIVVPPPTGMRIIHIIHSSQRQQVNGIIMMRRSRLPLFFSSSKLLNGRYHELALCRRVDGRSFENNMNPGFSIDVGVISEDEENKLVDDIRSHEKLFGFAAGFDQVYTQDSSGEKSVKSAIQARRMTGRPETPTQTHAPWGYAESFDRSKLFPSLLNYVEKVEHVKASMLNPTKLRDVTINIRNGAMFKLDPHVDPPMDGGNVLVMGLKSDVVFTLSPDINSASFMKQRRDKPLKIRTDPSAISLRSWTDDDLDILLSRRSLLHLQGDARHTWRHAIRTGLDVGEPYNAICDW